MRPALHTWLPLALGLLAWPGGAASAPDPEVARRSVGRAEVVAALERSGFSADAVLGADAAGLPLVCGTAEGLLPPELAAAAALQPAEAGPGGLPLGRRGWESIPGVIRNDGVETFVVEIDVNGPVTRVTLDGISPFLVPPASPSVELRDDGQGGDRVAGDRVYTSGPFRYRTTVPMATYFANDPTSPAGVFVTQVGTVRVEEADTVWTFSQQPGVGVLRAGIVSEVPFLLVSPVVAAGAHVINVMTGTRNTQSFLRSRGLNYDLTLLSNLVIDALPDIFDFFVFLSSDRVESTLRTAPENFVAGAHQTVRTSYFGTGQSTFDFGYLYGSRGVLQGVNAVDAYDRGLFSNFVTHEILHQWGSYLSSTLGLRAGAHYKVQSSVGSLLGGFQWTDTGDGLFDPVCAEGSNNASQASPLDLYLMGLIDGSEVPPLHVSKTFFDCTMPIYNYTTLAMADLQAVQGVRTPGPAGAQRVFRIGFVVESHNRFLNETEITFYEILAEHYARPLAAGPPHPYVSLNWAPISGFFGPGVTWRTDLEYTLTAATAPRPAGRAAQLRLGPGVPNPFRAATAIRCDVPAAAPAGRVLVQVSDLRGRSVRTLADREMGPGAYSLTWDGRDDRGARLPAGVYLCRAVGTTGTAARKLLLLD